MGDPAELDTVAEILGTTTCSRVGNMFVRGAQQRWRDVYAPCAVIPLFLPAILLKNTPLCNLFLIM